MEAAREQKVRRYPGVRSFEDEASERKLFRGRDSETYDLLQLIRAERLVILFARSGIGKSSIINAGLMEPLRQQGFFPMVARVASVKDDPIDSFYSGVRAACERATERGEISLCEPVDPSDWNRTSLWHFFKSLYVWRGEAELLRPVIIIDQFEELFTLLSEARRRPFIDQLADLVRGIRPDDAREQADERPALDDHPPDVRVVLAIREDFMANLEEMAERIPAILKARFRLGPLDVEQARRAIVEPAELASPELDTPPFTWSDDALQSALGFLRRRKRHDGGWEPGNEVEPFQLQLICQFAEGLVRDRKLTTITGADLGGEDALEGILSRFYRDVIDRVCDRFGRFGLRRRLRNFCEYGLITAKGRRLLREESTIQKEDGIPVEVLAELVERRLVRKERRVGDSYYELTHDTLIDPILTSRQQRESRRRNIAVGATAAALLLLVVAGGLAFRTRRTLQQAEGRLRAHQLIAHGKNWGDREQYALAAAFYQAAIARDSASGAELPDSAGEALRVARRDPAAAREEAKRAIEKANKAFAAVLEEDTAKALAHFHEEIEALVEAGNALAARRYPDAANMVYAAAKALEDTTNAKLRDAGQPTVEISRGEALRVAGLLAHAAYPEVAIQLYDSLEARFPDLTVIAESLNEVCWYGALFGDPAAVRDVCQRAVDRVDNGRSDGMIRDSRGVALVLTGGDPDQAMSDFRSYIAWGMRNRRSSRQLERRRSWIDELKAGGNPLVGRAVFDSLRAEDRNIVDEARLDLIDEYAEPINPEESLIQLMTEWALEPAVFRYLNRNDGPLCELADSMPPAECDESWADETLEGMERILSNPCSDRLKKLIERDFLAEVFITDSLGFNVCVSNLTSDYFQGEEDWWLAAKAWLPRAPVSRSGMERDASANEWAFVVYTAVRDPESDRFLGVIKAVFDERLGRGNAGRRGLRLPSFGTIQPPASDRVVEVALPLDHRDRQRPPTSSISTSKISVAFGPICWPEPPGP